MHIDVEQEADGRWLAEVSALPGCLVYGATREAARRGAEALALRICADRLDHEEAIPDELEHLFLATA